jgi:hypothetical protein
MKYVIKAHHKGGTLYLRDVAKDNHFSWIGVKKFAMRLTYQEAKRLKPILEEYWNQRLYTVVSVVEA